MEKSKELRKENRSDQKVKAVVWDCGSSLYDSFELNSFKRQLDSAISSRSLSMPHLSDRRVLPTPEPPAPAPAPAKKPSKISRSINKLLRSMFRPKPIVRFQDQQSKGDGGPIFVVYDKSGSLTTIPEAPEIDFGAFSPEIGSLVNRTGSERLTAANSIGISCA